MNKTTIKLSKELEGICERIDNDIEKTVGERIGFSLIVYTHGRASYISNVAREDAIPGLELLLKIWKEGMPEIKAHEVSG